jgi:hypothetical protein
MDNPLHRELTVLARMALRKSNEAQHESKRIQREQSLLEFSKLERLKYDFCYFRGRADAYKDAARLVLAALVDSVRTEK